MIPKPEAPINFFGSGQTQSYPTSTNQQPLQNNVNFLGGQNPTVQPSQPQQPPQIQQPQQYQNPIQSYQQPAQQNTINSYQNQPYVNNQPNLYANPQTNYYNANLNQPNYPQHSQYPYNAYQQPQQPQQPQQLNNPYANPMYPTTAPQGINNVLPQNAYNPYVNPMYPTTAPLAANSSLQNKSNSGITLNTTPNNSFNISSQGTDPQNLKSTINDAIWLSNKEKGLIDFSDFGNEIKKDNKAVSKQNCNNLIT